MKYESLEEYLEKVQFQKQLKKLNKKLKNKTVVVYGTGLLFKTVLEKYDLSAINIIGVSDKKFTTANENEECLGYKIVSINNIEKLNPDYILIATVNFLGIIVNFEDNILSKKTKIKVRPLVNKSFFTLLKEIWG